MQIVEFLDVGLDPIMPFIRDKTKIMKSSFKSTSSLITTMLVVTFIITLLFSNMSTVFPRSANDSDNITGFLSQETMTMSNETVIRMIEENMTGTESPPQPSANETESPAENTTTESPPEILNGTPHEPIVNVTVPFNDTNQTNTTQPTNVTIPDNTTNQTEENVTLPELNVTINETNQTEENTTIPDNTTNQTEENITLPETNMTINVTLNDTLNITMNETFNLTNETKINETMNVTNKTLDFDFLYWKRYLERRFKFKVLKFNKTKGELDFALKNSIFRIKGINISQLDRINLTWLKYGFLKKYKKTVDLSTDIIAFNNVSIDSAEITLEKHGSVNTILRCADFDVYNNYCPEWEETNIPFVDNGTHITFTVTEFSGYAGASITILNVQSYPTVDGNWTVEFTTFGTANLTITPVEGTTFGNEIPDDLEFLELWCSSDKLQPDFDGTKILYENYQCSETGKEVSKVLTSGRHVLEFQFGDETKYAENEATYDCANCADCSNYIQNSSSGDTVRLTEDLSGISGNCVEFYYQDNITFDCDGHYIEGDDSGYGVYLNDTGNVGSDNNTIKNCNLTNFSDSIYLR